MGLSTAVELRVGEVVIPFDLYEVEDIMCVIRELEEEGHRTWDICQILVTDFDYSYHQSRALTREYQRRNSA